jgi:hypothetical protein
VHGLHNSPVVPNDTNFECDNPSKEVLLWIIDEAGKIASDAFPPWVNFLYCQMRRCKFIGSEQSILQEQNAHKQRGFWNNHCTKLVARTDMSSACGCIESGFSDSSSAQKPGLGRLFSS